MRKYGLSFIMALLAAMFLCASAFAQDQPVMQQFKVVTEHGKEVLKPATNVSRGEIIEYRAVFTNHHNAALTGVQLNIPIPTGLDVILSSISPAHAEASADGKNFSAYPIKRHVRRGEAEIEEVLPLSAYKAIRWTIPTLAPGATVTVSVRVKVR